jgi:hypothetical protein
MCKKKKKPLGLAHLNNNHWNIAQNRILKMKLEKTLLYFWENYCAKNYQIKQASQQN